MQAGAAFPLTTEIDPTVPERYRKDVEFAQIEGRTLFRADRAAWVASDAVLAKGIPARHMPGADGWLSEQLDPRGDHWIVAFTEKNVDATPFVYADASVEFGEGQPRISVQENDPPRHPTNAELVLLRARDALASLEWLRCSTQYNASMQLFIDEGRKYAVVRELPARLDADLLPRGGFHRFRWPMFEGGQLEHFAQTRACMDEDARALPPGATFAMTLSTSEVPTEFDVFESLSYGRPHYVITDAGTWFVKTGKISWRSDKPEVLQ